MRERAEHGEDQGVDPIASENEAGIDKDTCAKRWNIVTWH